MLRLSQLQALKILEAINIRLGNLKKSMLDIMTAIDNNNFQFCKARRQGLELIKEFDRYETLAYRIIEKYLNNVTNCDEIKELEDIVLYYNEHKLFFQN